VSQQPLVRAFQRPAEHHYADDLADLVQHLDLHDAVHIGHSAGGGEVARYVGRHGESRVAKVIPDLLAFIQS
jgi:pimeloyl-ACP methyl ester carboxylesterase